MAILLLRSDLRGDSPGEVFGDRFAEDRVDGVAILHGYGPHTLVTERGDETLSNQLEDQLLHFF